MLIERAESIQVQKDQQLPSTTKLKNRREYRKVSQNRFLRK